MPKLEDMKCIVCEEVRSVDEISAHNGMCEACDLALADRDVPPEETILDPEMQGAVDRYLTQQAYRRKYNTRPEVVLKRRRYGKERRAKDKQLIEKARRLGLLPPKGAKDAEIRDPHLRDVRGNAAGGREDRQ